MQSWCEAKCRRGKARWHCKGSHRLQRRPLLSRRRRARYRRVRRRQRHHPMARHRSRARRLGCRAPQPGQESQGSRLGWDRTWVMRTRGWSRARTGKVRRDSWSSASWSPRLRAPTKACRQRVHQGAPGNKALRRRSSRGISRSGNAGHGDAVAARSDRLVEVGALTALRSSKSACSDMRVVSFADGSAARRRPRLASSAGKEDRVRIGPHPSSAPCPLRYSRP